MGLPGGPYGPTGSCRPLVVKHSAPRSGSRPLEPHQDSTCPYAFRVGVVDDRSVLMGLPGGSYGPTGSCRPLVV